MVVSEYLAFEVTQNPDPDRARKVGDPLRWAGTFVHVTPRLAARARGLEKLGLRGLDALHVASAEAGKADLLVTTDDRLIRRGRRGEMELSVRIVSPLDALARLAEEVAK